MSDVTKVPLPGLLRGHANVIPNALTSTKGASYDLELWRNAFAGNPSVTRDLDVIGKKCPSPIRRRDIQALAREACNGDDAETRRLFLASMIWGWGNRGRGLKHTATSLADPALAEVLKHTVKRVRSGNITAAYNGFSLKGCGPAFFTKFFYFVGLGCNVKPLPVILDTRVAECLESVCNQEGWDFGEFANVGRNKEGKITYVKRHAKGYVKYVDSMADWAAQLDCGADSIEYFMFNSAPLGRARKKLVGGVPVTGGWQEFTVNQARQFSMANGLGAEAAIIDKMQEPKSWVAAKAGGTKGSEYWFKRAKIGNHVLLWQWKGIQWYPLGRNPSGTWKKQWNKSLCYYLRKPEGMLWHSTYNPGWLGGLTGVPVPPPQPLTVELAAEQMTLLDSIARECGTDPKSLVKIWVAERLRRLK